MSGTSMATPHVAGLLAYLIGVNGNGSPKDLTATLKNLADADAVHGARECCHNSEVCRYFLSYWVCHSQRHRGSARKERRLDY